MRRQVIRNLARRRCQLLSLTVHALRDDAKFSTNSGKSGAGSLKLFVLVGCRHLDANSCLTFRHNRVTEPHDVDSFFQEPLCHSGGECGVAQHHRDNGVLAGNEPESKGGELRAEERRVLAQPGPQLVALSDEGHGSSGCRGNDRGQ